MSLYKDHQGIVLAATATVIWAACVAALNLESGFGWPLDLLFVAVVVTVGIPLAALSIATVVAILRHLPSLLTGFLVAVALSVSLLWFNRVGALFAAILVLVECAMGASLVTILRGELHDASTARRILTWSILAATVAANTGIFVLLHSDGLEEELLQVREEQSSLPAPLTASDPSKTGPYRVKTLYYGSGDSLRRAEFGSNVAIRTRTVDASAFFKDFDGWRAWIRERYWGFGMDKLPLNANVFYPDGAGPFPLFVMVHGNHNMSVPSDNGYAYLCELLASRGFIAVSIDENFLNLGVFSEPPNQQAVRGWLLLEHLRLWHEWARDPASPFFRKPDLTRIAVGGHSRGGEAAATAVLFNRLAYYPDDASVLFHYGYAIKAVVAIAPPDGQYKPAEQWRFLKDVNYLTLQGANDSDLSIFEGSRQYDHVRFSGTVPAFKSELYIYRANHGQFNTMWGRTDSNAPANWFLDLQPLLTGDQQRQIAKVYVSAFLEATLHGKHEYADLFRDYRRGRQWVPDTLYVNRFQDDSYKTICSFNEDADVTTTTAPGGHISANGLTVWHEGKIPFRDGNRDYNGVFLGWNSKAKNAPDEVPSYSVDLPPGVDSPALELSVAVTDDDADETYGSTNFSIEAMSENGVNARVAAASFALLLPPLRVRFMKLEQLDKEFYKNPAEPAFQSIHVPFSAFVAANAAFDPHHVQRVRLIFDKTPTRTIIISGIGLSK